MIILATEGLNATIAGPKSGVDAVLQFIRADQRFAGMPHRECETDRDTFHRLRLVIRQEIVTLGDPSVNPNDAVGEYVTPEDWNALISDPDVLLIDTRNDYEVGSAHFRAPPTRTPPPSANGIPMCNRSWPKPNIRRLPCSAPAASAVKRPRRIY